MHILDEIRLLRFVDSQRGKPFQWGFRDCNTLGLHILDMLTGAQYAQKVRGRYGTEIGAIRFFKKCGLDWIRDLPEKFGATRIKPGFERAGDFLIVQTLRWQACHVCLGESAVTVTPERGVEIVPLSVLDPYRVFRLPVEAVRVGAGPGPDLTKIRMSA